MLSDTAFKLYVFLCLNVDRHSARMVWEALELAKLLQRDRNDFSPWEWLYLYAQAARFSLAAVRV